MCSILGFVDAHLNQKEVEALNKKMSHRGLDASCVREYKFNSHQIYLAHNRLAILDLNKSASQPMENSDFAIVFNGEIYNHLELRRELKFKEFKTHSDTETLLYSFSELGINKTLSKINGMFAIALLNKRQGVIYLIRDRVGIKPLYYTLQGAKFAFSSELKGFAPNFKEGINQRALIEFMALGYIPYSSSYYKDIYKLPPAHILKFDIKSSKIELNRYWDLPKEKLNISFNEAIEKTHELLKSSIKYRLLSDVEVGAFLSGGIDSSLVSAIMAKKSSKRIKTFTIGFSESDFNEAIYAKEVAKHIDSEHFEYYFKAQDVLDLISKIDYYYDEPFGDASALPTMLLAKMTKEQVSVALSGDGGDELFLGYNRYFFTDSYYKRLSKIPKPIRELLSILFKYSSIDKLEKMAYPIKHLSKENLYSILSTSIKPWDLSRVFNSEYIKESLLTLESYKGEFETIEDFSKFDFYRYLPDDILVKVDRATMAYTLEARVPILDYRLVEFAYSLPESIKLQNGAKSILKEIAYSYIPKELINRPKKGFSVPLKRWFRGELKDILLDKINSLDERFNKEYLLKLFDKHQKGANYEYIFWNLMRIK